MSGTLVSIQVLRALAALAVTVAHTNAETAWIAAYLKTDYVLPGFLTGAAGVDLFFVISGFVMIYSSGRYFGSARGSAMFFARRLVRIVPLYWLATGLTLLQWWHIGTSLKQEGATWSNVVTSLLFIPQLRPAGGWNPILGAGWSLNYEMFFYVCFAVALIMGRRMTALGLTIAFYLLATYGHLVWLPIELHYLGNANLLVFALGLLIGLAYCERLRVPRALAITCLIVGIGILALSAIVDLTPYASRFWIWAVPCALIVLGSVYAGELPSPGPCWRALSFLGDISYALYLTHGLAMVSLRTDFFGFAVWLGQWQWAYASTLVVTSLALAIVVYVVIERPITRALQRLVRRLGTPQVTRPAPALAPAA